MKTLLFGLCASVLCAQVGLDAPRFGCALNAGRAVEMRGLRGNLVSHPLAEGAIRAITCGDGLVVIHRGDSVEVNGQAVARISGPALLTVANGRVFILDVDRRRLGDLEMPESATAFAVEGGTLRVLNREGVWSFDLATGASLDFWAFASPYDFAAVMSDGRILAVEGAAVKRCSSTGCEALFDLPDRVASLSAFNGDWRLAALEGGARVALCERGFFLLPGGAE